MSWFMTIYLFGILVTYAMEINVNNYSINQLEHEFGKLKKNPQKYVEFQLNAENTEHSDASGLYELLPYYQKINPLGKKENYAIKWCEYVKKWQFIKVNPLGDLPRFDVEETIIATLLKSDQFSKPTNATIKAYTTYEHMKSIVKTVSEKNKELKMKIIEMKKKSVCVQTEIISVREANEKLKETLTKMKEQYKKLKNFAKKDNEQNTILAEGIKIKAEENEKFLKELEDLTSNLKAKEIQIGQKNEEIRALLTHNGKLSYKLSSENEFKQKFLSLEKEIEPLKAKLKHNQVEIKQLNKISKHWEADAQDLQKTLNRQVTKNTETDLNRNIFQDYQFKKENEIKQMQKEMEKYYAEVQKNQSECKGILLKQNKEIKLLKEMLKKLKNAKEDEINLKDAFIQSLQRTIKKTNESSGKDATQFQCEIRISNTNEFKELKEENQNLRILLEKCDLNSKSYETLKKRFKVYNY